MPCRWCSARRRTAFELHALGVHPRHRVRRPWPSRRRIDAAERPASPADGCRWRWASRRSRRCRSTLLDASRRCEAALQHLRRRKAATSRSTSSATRICLAVMFPAAFCAGMTLAAHHRRAAPPRRRGARHQARFTQPIPPGDRRRFRCRTHRHGCLARAEGTDRRGAAIDLALGRVLLGSRDRRAARLAYAAAAIARWRVIATGLRGVHRWLTPLAWRRGFPAPGKLLRARGPEQSGAAARRQDRRRSA